MGGYLSDMERETTKHGPILDEEMKREEPSVHVGSPDEGHHWAHGGPGEEQPPLRTRTSEDPPGDGTLTRAEAELRSEIARVLNRSIWPADRDTILRDAAASDPTEDVVRLLDRLPIDDRRYETVEAVWEALGGRWETRD